MPAILVQAVSPISADAFDRADSSASAIWLSESAVAGTSAALLGRVVERRSLLISLAGGVVRGAPLAIALVSDFLAIREDATIDLGNDAIDPQVAAGVVRRIGSRARWLLMASPRRIGAAEAVRLGLADTLVASEVDSLKWFDSWLAKRSLRALLAGAALVRSNGGDALERAEFARLFAEGEPRRGLMGFLEKKPVDFTDDLEVVTI
jgi:enoyl-CoA hydratase/carnithine racemase